MIEVSQDILKNIYKERPPQTQKYDYGLLLVIGGSEYYSGAPALAALAAFKAGADMVNILAPQRAADIIASFSPNLSAFALEGSSLRQDHLAVLLSMAESARKKANGNAAIVIGGGIGRNEKTQKVILDYLSQISMPVVIDADAIHAAAKKPEILAEKNFLITPHAYEFFILTGIDIKQFPQDKKIEIVKEQARRLKTTILFKGKIDIISNGKDIALNKTGSPYLSKGGTGDTLAGICGALLARKINAFTAAQAGAYINGKAGELAAKRLREGLLATDLIEAIPEVLH